MSSLFSRGDMECLPVQITSIHNTVIKEIKALKNKKYRDETGLFFIEGMRFVDEALKADARLRRLVISGTLSDDRAGKELLERLGNSNCEKYIVAEKLFNEMSDTDSPQGVLAVVEAEKPALSLLRNMSFLVILDSIQDPGNLGTIIRTADAAGAEGILLSKGCVDLYNPKVLRSTMGSVFHVPAFQRTDTIEIAAVLKTMGFKLYAAHLEGRSNYFETDMTGKIAIIIGNEANGINSELTRTADLLVKIPIIGRAESLNASVAAGLMMYEAVRQRNA